MGFTCIRPPGPRNSMDSAGYPRAQKIYKSTFKSSITNNSTFECAEVHQHYDFYFFVVEFLIITDVSKITYLCPPLLQTSRS